jgi:hypothetical protein
MNQKKEVSECITLVRQLRMKKRLTYHQKSPKEAMGKKNAKSSIFILIK